MRLHSYRYIILLLLCIFRFQNASSADDTVLVSGTVKNSKNKKAIENVSLSLNGSNISTVTNSDGFFKLKAPKKLFEKGVKFEKIGFQTLYLDLESLDSNGENLQVLLDPTGKVLTELVVLGGDPREVVKTALLKIPENYSDKNNLFEGFYRETVQKGNKFISISEAMVDVLKRPYRKRSIMGDKVSIKKGRTILSPKSSDTLSVKLAGGPYMSVLLDVVKNGDHLFTVEEMDNFNFKMEQPAMIDNRMHYVVNFTPKVSLSYPLHKGIIYIDGDNLAINRVEFELDMSDKNKATEAILRKKPFGLRFNPQEVSGMVSYKTIDGKSYINYVFSKMRFKCDWKKRLFSSGYTTIAEMVMVDRDDSPEKNVKFAETFGKRNIFSDIVGNYWEEDYWKDFNIIEPTESLEKAIIKLKKQK